MSNALRQELIETALEMNASGINQGTSGNLSARFEGGMLITPSGVRYEKLSPGDIVFVDQNGHAQGSRKPSSEWRFHHDIYRTRNDAHAVVHSHPRFCSSLACMSRSIPAFHYMVAVAGGSDIRCAAYATFGTQQLSDNVIAALDERKACLMANHGMVCLEAKLEKALALAVEIEHLAAIYCQSLEIGEPTILDDDEMKLVIDKFRNYGEPDDS